MLADSHDFGEHIMEVWVRTLLSNLIILEATGFVF